ncbi:ubiquinol oxidase subunit II [Rhizobium sp. NPDC090275]|uniref:ubiquinol oxidase subunit II n=1 Tax=Rhizobium sp. NPDC090275 TaxID=3364498 RepID=UPI00383B4E3B
MQKLSKFSRHLVILPLFFMLAGCNLVVMSPSGDIAMQQRDLIIVSVLLMLLIIIPVICLTLFFAWRYRQSNTSATYDPEWHHSTRLEVVIWSAPLAIIIVLGAITWITTHKLDPYRPLDRIDAERTIPADVKPLTVQVVALDWKWLFFYPELGIATVNELAAPVDVPINFEITASSVMNSFYIPALAGQIYAMPGMQTKLHAVINKEGVYDGFSANYSGAGFSHMRFKFHGMNQQGFESWVAQVKNQGTALNRDAYLKLERPSEREPVRYYATADKDLYNAILNMCATPGKMCMNEMMHIDMMGGAGKESHENRDKLKFEGEPIDGFHPPAAGESQDAPAHGAESMDNMPGMQNASDATAAPAMTMQHDGHTMPSSDASAPAATK